MKTFKLIFYFFFFISFLHSQDLEKISLQLQWKHQFQFAGYYIAKEKGYFKKAGLDVNIKEFTYGMSTTKEVLSNKSEYAIGRASLIVDKSKGKDIVLLTSIFQSSPLILLTTQKDKIKNIQDFRNKNIMLVDDTLRNTAIRAMLLSQGVNYSDINRQVHSFNLDDLINQKTDLMTSYISNEPFRLKEKGIEYSYFAPKDFGYDFYSDLLFTSKEEIITNPKRVKRFIEASLKGWEYAFLNIEETVDLIYEKYNTQNKSKEALLHEAKELKKLAKLDLVPLGNINKLRIQKIYDVYHILGMIDKHIKVDDFVYNENYEKRFLLSNKEMKYLDDKKELKMCIDPNWLPFEKIENGKHIGMSSEYIKLFQEKLPIPIKLVETKNWLETVSFAKQRKCDFISMMGEDDERKLSFLFSDPLIKMPIVIASQIDKIFISDLASLEKEKFAIVKGFAYANILKQKYPNINIVEVKNAQEGLSGVKNGFYYGFVGILPVIGYNIQENFIGDLKIAGKLNDSWSFPMASRNDEPILNSILNKLINSLTSSQKQEILNNWIAIKYQETVDYKNLFILSGFFIFVILIVLYKNNSIRRINKKLEDYIKLVDENVLTSSTDLHGTIVYVSKAFCEISGYTKEELIGKNHNIVKHDDMKDEVFNKMWNVIKKGDVWQGEVKNKKKNGGYYWIKMTISPIFDETKQIVGYTAIRHDITDKKLVEELSITDGLTNIYNRRHFNDIFPKYINGAKRKDEIISFLIMDVDYFKQYNDTYGHQKGDEVLKKIANVLKQKTHRADDVCFRLGGEEFGMLYKADSKEKAYIFANIIKNSIEELKITHSKSLANNYVTVSMGLYSKNANEIEDFNDVFKRADELLYKSKEEGRNRISSK